MVSVANLGLIFRGAVEEVKGLIAALEKVLSRGKQ